MGLYDCLSSPLPELAGDATPLATGLALSPFDAASCVKDGVRTAVFFRGVEAALTQALERFSGEAIDVLYAGTGPLAPLLIPLLPRFEGRALAVTLVDVHPEAVQAARTVAEHFGVLGFIRDSVVADASTYRHPRPLHVVITETMQRALTREPQVAIVRQLAPQLVAGGILVPESVRVALVCGDVVHPLLDLHAGTAAVAVDAAGCLPPVRVKLPERWETHPLYQTTIVAHGDHVILPGKSGLTHPEMAWDLMSLAPETELEFRYQMGQKPGFIWTAVTPVAAFPPVGDGSASRRKSGD